MQTLITEQQSVAAQECKWLPHTLRSAIKRSTLVEYCRRNWIKYGNTKSMSPCSQATCDRHVVRQ